MSLVIQHIKNYTGNRGSFLNKRWGWDAPSGTMVGFDFIHPDAKRMLTFREAMRLCAYPDTFTCHSAVEAVDTVLPLIGEWFGGIFKTALKRGARVNDLSFEVIDHRPLARRFHLGIQSRCFRPWISGSCKMLAVFIVGFICGMIFAAWLSDKT